MILNLIKKNLTLKELLIGITFFGIIGEILLLILTKQKMYNGLGFLVGVIVSLICAIHMAYYIDIAVMLDEKSSIAYMRKYTVIRYLVMCVVLIIIGVTDILSPVTLILGYMGLKIGAYLNPLVHKIYEKLCGGNEKE